MELFAADGHDAGGCERVTGKSGMRPIFSRFEKLDVMFIGFIHFVLMFDALR